MKSSCVSPVLPPSSPDGNLWKNFSSRESSAVLPRPPNVGDHFSSSQIPGGAPRSNLTYYDVKDIEDYSNSGQLLHSISLPKEPPEGSETEPQPNISGCMRVADFFQDFGSAAIWRAALVEGITTAIFVVLSFGTIISCLQSNFDVPLAASAFVHFLLVSFCIYAAAAASGGHFNPAITMCTILTGHTSIIRGIIYIMFQSGGAVVGSLIIRDIVGEATALKYSLGGCELTQAVTQNGVSTIIGMNTLRTAFLTEFVFTFALLHFIYSVAMDPMKLQLFGVIRAPALAGAAVAVLIFVSGALRSGYAGAGMNPARCLGPAVVLGGQLWHNHWIVFWGAPFCASIVQAFLFHIVPANHVEIYNERRTVFHQSGRILRSFAR